MKNIFITLCILSFPLILFSQHVQVGGIKQPVHFFEKISVSPSGKLLATTFSGSNDIAVFETITGKEIQRLHAKEDCAGVEFLNDSVLIRINPRTVELVNIRDETVTATIAQDRLFFDHSYAAKANIMAVGTYNGIFLIDFSNGILKEINTITVENHRNIEISPDGRYVAAKVKDTIICWNILSKNITARIEAKNMISFGMGTGSLIILNKSPLSYQHYRYDGIPETDKKKIELVSAPYYSAISPFGDGFTFTTYNKTVTTYPGGYQEVIKTGLADHKALFDSKTQKLITWNHAKIEITDLEGSLFTRISAQQIGSAHIFPDDTTGRVFHVLSDSSIQVVTPEKTIKKIGLGSKIISTLAYAGKWKVIQLNNKDIAIYDKEKQSVHAKFRHHSIPVKYAASPNNSGIWFIDRIENAVYRYSIQSGEKRKVYTQPALITAINATNNFIYIGDESGNILQLGTSGTDDLKVLQNTNIFGNPITAIKALKNEVLAASYGRFLSVGKDFTNQSAQKLFIGHNGFITSIETNNSETIIYTTAEDKFIKLWDSKKANAIADYALDSVVANHIIEPDDATFFFTGYDVLLAAVTDTSMMRKWKNVDQRIVLQTPNNNMPLKLALNQQGTLLASVDNNTVKVRDIKRGFLLNEYNLGEDPVNGITFSADGKMLAVAAGEYVYTFDPYNGSLIRKIDMAKTARIGSLGGGTIPTLLNRSFHDIEAYQNVFVAFNVNGWHDPLMIHKNSGLKLFEFTFNTKDHFDNQIYDFKCTPDGLWFATFGSSFVKVFLTKDSFQLKYVFPRTSRKMIEYHSDYMSFSPDGKYFSWVDINKGKQLRIIDLSNGNKVQDHPGGYGVLGKNGDYYFADTDETITKANVLTANKEVLEYKWDQVINNIVYNETQNIIAAGDIWGNIKVIDGRSGKSITELNRWDQYNYSARLSPDKRTMVFNNRWGLYVVDMNTLKRDSLPGNNFPFSAVFAPDGKKIYFRNKDLILSKSFLTQAIDTIWQNEKLKGSGFKNMRISSDGVNLIILFNSEDITLVNINEKKPWFTFSRFDYKKGSGFLPKDIINRQGVNYLLGIHIETYGDSSGMSYALISTDGKFTKQPLTQEINLARTGKTGFTEKVFEEDAKVFERSPSGKYLAYMKNMEMYVLNIKTGDIIFNRDNTFGAGIVKAVFDKDDRYFILATDNGFVEIYDLDKRSIVKNSKDATGLALVSNFRMNEMGIETIQVEENALLVKGSNSFLTLYDIKGNKSHKLMDMAFIRDNDQVYIDRDGYYYASKEALNYIAYKRGNDFLSIDLTDMQFNRPDKLLRAAASDDTLLIRAFHNAYLKRLQKNRIDSSWKPDFEEIPECILTNAATIPYDIEPSSLPLKFSFHAVKGSLRSMNIWINNVPLFGKNGTALSQKSMLDTTITITLSTGINKIEYAVHNTMGMESVRTPLFIRHTPAVQSAEKIYFIGIGIDKFSDAQYNLQYSAKDIRDLAMKFKEKYKSNITIDTLFNENVTAEKIRLLKKQLLHASVNDKVIVAYSGHGLLSRDYDYYLSTYSVNFNNPGENGLPYDEMESLLDGIPARKKLLLIDACHSGEVDKEEGIAMDSSAAALGLTKGLSLKPSKKPHHVGLKNSFELMQNLFVNVGSSTGTTIISAAAGNQYALERGDLKNGVFTYCLIEALDNHSSLKISELKKKVGERVVEITKGLQKPTSRNETLAVDWLIW